ncbi:MAG TPA: quinolinate synthase NadA [Syntrophomonadaceae bacterium]|nr:quinolinate synthase NadA [Syntrophomonadaceae bacterium]
MHDTRSRELMDEIIDLKKQNNVFLLAHYYQRPEIQMIADYVGDSYAMALAARNCSQSTILVAGVDFMAETAAVLCPDKTILTPEPLATCPMANSVNIEDILKYRQEHPDAVIVSYVNTPAEVKAVSDVCCTSSNAARIVAQFAPDKQVLFVPDQHLGNYIAEKLGRHMEVYYSECPTHQRVTVEQLDQLKEQYPEAAILVHPECRKEIRDRADYIGSTSGIIDYAEKSNHQVLIIVTESGIMHSISEKCPNKKAILASQELICPNMKSITLEKIYHSIVNNETIVEVSEDTRIKSVAALEKMIEWASRDIA